MAEHTSAGTSLLNAFLKLVVFVLLIVVVTVFILTALFFLDIPVDDLLDPLMPKG